MVRTPGFHPGNRGSIPLGITILKRSPAKCFFNMTALVESSNPKVRKEGESRKFTCETRTDGIAVSLRLPLGITKSLMPNLHMIGIINR